MSSGVAVVAALAACGEDEAAELVTQAPVEAAAAVTKAVEQAVEKTLDEAPASALAKFQASEKDRWAGKTFRYAGLESMGGSLIEFMQPWFEETGATVDRAAFGQQELEDKALQAMATGTFFSDAFQFNSNSSGDVMGGGLLLEVPDWVKDFIEWDDVMPLFRDRIISWKGTAFSAPYDGDKHYMAYRRDLMVDAENSANFEKKYGYAWDPETGPKTWDEHRDIAEFFTGWDWEGDGSTEHSGFSHMMKRKDTLWWGFNSRAAAYNKHPEDKGYHFDVDTMEPRVSGEGFLRALEEWKDEFENFGPATSLNDGWGGVIENYVTAKSFMAIGWSDHGTAAQDLERSLIKGKSGYSMNPGSKEVFNYKSGKWENFPEISYAPFIAFGGWIIAVPNNTNNADMAWDFVAVATSKEIANKMVTAPTGVNPLRFSQMEPELWVASDFKWGREEAVRMLKGESDTINHPNALMDLRLPGWVQYRDSLELHVARALAGETGAQEALDAMAKDFDDITERFGGRDAQLPFYREAMGAS